MITKFKLYGAAMLAFFLSLLTAKYYQSKARKYQKIVVKAKAEADNLKAQRNAAIKHQQQYQKEIEDAVKNDSYLDYFDKS
jgi:predicted membrane protein